MSSSTTPSKTVDIELLKELISELKGIAAKLPAELITKEMMDRITEIVKILIQPQNLSFLRDRDLPYTPLNPYGENECFVGTEYSAITGRANPWGIMQKLAINSYKLEEGTLADHSSYRDLIYRFCEKVDPVCHNITSCCKACRKAMYAGYGETSSRVGRCLNTCDPEWD